MGLFGDDQLIDVDTPQGSQKLPASVAQALGLKPSQSSQPGMPPPIDSSLLGAPQSFPSVDPGSLPAATKPVIPPPVDSGLVGAPGAPQPTAPAVPAAPKSATPAPADTGPAPMSTADLEKMGIAGALNVGQKALQSAEDAGNKKADAEANQQLAFAGAYEKRNQQIDDLLKKRTDDAEARQKDIDNKLTEYQAAVKKYGDTKIDRSVDHPILAGIGVLLAGIGSVMNKNGDNPGLAALDQAIDRKVKGQMQDLEQQGAMLGMKKTDLEMLRQSATDSSARYNQMVAGETLKAANQIEAIGARSNSDIVRARAQEAAAALKQKAADAVGAAVMAQQAKDDRDRNFKLAQSNNARGWAEFAENKKNNVRDFEEGKRRWEAEYGLKVQTEQDKVNKDALKQMKEFAVIDPTTGNPFLNEDGQKRSAQIDQFEAQARQAKDPAQQQALQAQADKARRDMYTDPRYVASAPNAKIAEKTNEKLEGSQNIVREADKLLNFLKGDPSSFDRKSWADAQVTLGNMLVNYEKAVGEKVSPRAMEAVQKHIISWDPSDMSSRMFGQGKAEAAIQALKDDIQASANQALTSARIKTPFVPHSPEAAPQLRGKTAGEMADAAEPSTIAKGERAILYPGGGGPDPQKQAAEAGLSTVKTSVNGRVVDTGIPTVLDPQDANTVYNLAKAAKGANAAKYDQIVGQLQSYARSPRGQLGAGVVSLLQNVDPQLAKVVAADLPRSERDASEPTSGDVAAAHDLGHAAAVQSTPLPVLTQAAIAGDADSKKELARRAANGDRSAGQAIMSVLQGVR